MGRRKRELAELRTMVGERSDDFWVPNDYDAPDDEEPNEESAQLPGFRPDATGKIVDQVELSALLWPPEDVHHELTSRFKRLVSAVFTAASFALFGAADVLNAHIRANGRLVFVLDRDSFPLLLRFFFHGTRDGIEPMLQGVPKDVYAYTASRARLPSWVRTTTIEAAFAARLFNKIVYAQFESAHQAFELVVRHRIAFLRSDDLPDVDSVVEEAYQREREESGGERETRPPLWSLYPSEDLAPVLNDLFALYPIMVCASLEERLVGITIASMLENPEMPQHVKEAFALAQSLKERADVLGGDVAAIRLASAASVRAHRLWSFDRKNRDSLPLPFPSPRFEAPDLVFNCATMRDLLLSLGVPLPSLEECKADALGLFGNVFRIHDYVNEVNARERRKFRFHGVIRTNGKDAFVHLVPRKRSAEKRITKGKRSSKTLRCDPAQGAHS